MDKEERKRWLDTLTEGDSVAIKRTGYFGAPYSVLQVERLTPTQFVLSNERRAHRKNGELVGSRIDVIPVTREILDAVATYELVQWAASLVTEHGRKHPPLPVLRALKDAYDKATGSPP